MKKIFVLIVLLLSLTAIASEQFYYPLDFLEKLHKNYLKDDQLKSELHKILDGWHLKNEGQHDQLISGASGTGSYKHKPVTYDGARKIILGKLHLQQEVNGRYFLEDVYCHRHITKGVGPNKIPNNNDVNVEHTWPQSRFSNYLQSWQKSDLHHLFPVDSRANSVRGNLNFAEIGNGEEAHSDCRDSLVGYAEIVLDGKKERYFEPPTEQKGNVARALFYFSVRYKIKIRPTEEAYLRDWHIEDPVDQFEIERNGEILKLQGNRNPFIDLPELVNLISDF